MSTFNSGRFQVKYNHAIILSLCRSGQSYGKIAKEVGCTPSLVGLVARAAGLASKPPIITNPDFWTEAITAELVARYDSESVPELAKAFGVTVASIKAKAHKLGIRNGPRRRLQGEVCAARNASVNIHYFEDWSPNMAYILGYIWADGSLIISDGRHTLAFLCTRSDEKLLLDIRSEMKSTHAIVHGAAHTQMMKNGRIIRGKPTTAVRICSKSLVRSLMELHGLEPRKTNKDLPFPTVPDDLLCHFARGNFDGDGSVSRRKNRPNAGLACWLGTPSFARELQRRICLGAGIPPKAISSRHVNLVRFGWEAKAHLSGLFQWLYPEGDYLLLKRKRDKFQEIVTHQASFVKEQVRGTWQESLARIQALGHSR